MRNPLFLCASLYLLALCLPLCGCTGPGPRDHPPMVIAHRGASAYLPEHTLAAYALAYGQGADVIEPDVVLTRDGVAICAHDMYADGVTNAMELFPDRARTIDGQQRIAWADLTLDEARRLEVMGNENWGRGFRIATLDEMVDMIQALNQRTGKRPPTAIIPEIKNPAAHHARNLDAERAVVECMLRHGLRSRTDPAIIQCFDLPTLKRVRAKFGCNLPLLWTLREPPTDAQLDEAARTVEGIIPSRKLIERDDGTSTDLLARARARNLLVIPFTFGDEPQVTRRFYRDHRVDGLFTNNPDVALESR